MCNQVSDLEIRLLAPRLQKGYRWRIDFESWGQYKSPLMHWGRASNDVLSRHYINANNMHSAIEYCQENGWGYDVQYPGYRWHTKKSYADNFVFRGPPKEQETLE